VEWVQQMQAAADAAKAAKEDGQDNPGVGVEFFSHVDINAIFDFPKLRPEILCIDDRGEREVQKRRYNNP